jgi:hypothetical protein
MMLFGRIPRRLKREAGHHALVDGIPFHLPVTSTRMQALMVGFPIDAQATRALLPPSVTPVRLLGKSLLVVTVVNYQETVIGKYIEFSVALACSHHGAGPFRFGQYVVDLPVSTEISVKGGKGIWGMPKHQANLDFSVREDAAASQYDDDGQLVMYVEIRRPKGLRLPVSMGASNYCQFRGMLMKSDVYFRGKAQVAFGHWASGKVEIGDHPRLQPLKQLGIAEKPMFTVFIPGAHGVLDDHVDSWFLAFERAPEKPPEGMESVIDLGLGQEWLPPPQAPH